MSPAVWRSIETRGREGGKGKERERGARGREGEKEGREGQFFGLKSTLYERSTALLLIIKLKKTAYERSNKENERTHLIQRARLRRVRRQNDLSSFPSSSSSLGRSSRRLSSNSSSLDLLLLLLLPSSTGTSNQTTSNDGSSSSSTSNESGGLLLGCSSSSSCYSILLLRSSTCSSSVDGLLGLGRSVVVFVIVLWEASEEGKKGREQLALLLGSGR